MDLRIPVSSNRWFAYRVRVANVKMPRLLVFRFFCGVFGGGTRLAMPKTICMPDSSSLKPGSGATEGVLD